MNLIVKNLNTKLLILLVPVLLSLAACHKNDYPCPGLGQSDEADLSMFDENGQLKKDGRNSRINKSNGLVKKKKPKKLNAPRKTHL